jgi:hypothetical protein
VLPSVVTPVSSSAQHRIAQEQCRITRNVAKFQCGGASTQHRSGHNDCGHDKDDLARPSVGPDSSLSLSLVRYFSGTIGLVRAGVLRQSPGTVETSSY